MSEYKVEILEHTVRGRKGKGDTLLLKIPHELSVKLVESKDIGGALFNFDAELATDPPSVIRSTSYAVPDIDALIEDLDNEFQLRDEATYSYRGELTERQHHALEVYGLVTIYPLLGLTIIAKKVTTDAKED